MKRTFNNWFLIFGVCASFIIIDAENYELTHKMLDEVDSSGFISIDCGSSTNYYDNDSGFWYQTDENFVETGESIMVPGEAHSSLNYPYFGKRLQTLRCFPYGVRNCYTLRPKQGNSSKYLIRAFFSYGNYDMKNQTQSYDLYLGVNLWDTINFDDVDTDFQLAEIIHTPSSSDSIQVCLVKTGESNPCISSLELRPLNSSIYPIMSTAATPQGPQPLLSYDVRIDFGFFSSRGDLQFSRYKDDIYDRIWRYDDTNLTGWYSIKSDNTTIANDPRITFDAYRVPAEVLMTASETRNVSYPLNFDLNSVFTHLDKNLDYHVYLHFAEIKQLPLGKKRIIEKISFNSDGNILSEPLVLEYLKPVTVYHHIANANNVVFSIIAASESGAPPILNAFEGYKSIRQPDSPTDTRDGSAMMEIKNTYKISKLTWQGDPCLPIQFRWEGLSCTSDTNPRITSLNMSSSNLKGVINSSFSILTELKFLDLSDNELEGPLPEFLAELPKLEVLNLNGNKLSGSIPKALKEKQGTTLQLSVDNNPDLCLTDSCNNNNKKKKNFTVPIVASLSALVLILLISLGCCIFKRTQKDAYTNSRKGPLETKNRAFSYNEILNMTDNFKTIIGEGGFGKVYNGILQYNVQVAVKLLSPSSVQGFREFRSEAQLLSLVHHRNLVSLIGYCDEGDTKALIYEYMPNGNLLQHLSDKNPYVLKWNERLNIAADTANGLDYLHNGCKPPIVHRDLKTSNILLDQSNHAKIADFGLSRAFFNDIDSHISTRPAGTPGYIDPEFHRTGNSNKKSDVYSFGIILLELITGKPAIARSVSNGETIHILNWVKPKVERGEIKGIVDPRLNGDFDTNSAWKLVEIALSCTSPIPIERPDISEIFVELKECLSLDITKIGITLDQISSPIDTEFAPLAR